MLIKVILLQVFNPQLNQMYGFNWLTLGTIFLITVTLYSTSNIHIIKRVDSSNRNDITLCLAKHVPEIIANSNFYNLLNVF